MTAQLSNFLWGTIWVAAGVLILTNLDALLLFDKKFGIRLRAWFHKQLGNSFLNRPIWSHGASSGFPSWRISKILLTVPGLTLLLLGAVDLFEPVLVRISNWSTQLANMFSATGSKPNFAGEYTAGTYCRFDSVTPSGNAPAGCYAYSQGN
jgi:hypothetical protein